MPQIEIRYRRPPDRLQVFSQQLVVDRPDCKVTLMEGHESGEPIRIGERTIFEPGAAMIWFLFPDAWFDIGRFHLRDGTFTGYYGNLIIPPKLEGDTWEIFDLCLDLWVDRSGELQVLDQDEFDEAVDRLWIDPATAERARRALETLIAEARAGRWPPPLVKDYDLTCVRRLASAEP